MHMHHICHNPWKRDSAKFQMQSLKLMHLCYSTLEWNSITPQTCLQGVDKDSFTFTFTIQCIFENALFLNENMSFLY
jgi:hypothetical protein